MSFTTSYTALSLHQLIIYLNVLNQVSSRNIIGWWFHFERKPHGQLLVSPNKNL